MALQVADLEDASEESGLVIRQNGEEEVLRVKRMDAKATDQVLQRLLDGLQQHVRSDAEQVVPDLLIDVAVFLLVEKHATSSFRRENPQSGRTGRQYESAP